jgi:phage I-like protein
MPYEIRSDHPSCSGYAVVKKGGGNLMGCHPTREKAMKQMAALYAQEPTTEIEMKNENPRGSAVIAAAKIDGDRKSWIEVMPTADKAKNGPWFFTLTREDLDAAVASIAERADRAQVDYDHKAAEGDSRAAGWFTGQARVIESGQETPNGETATKDSVWAEVQWTPQAVQEIRDGVFKFVSAEWSMKDKDAKSGLMTKFKEWVAATLTNRPFFQELAPVTAKELISEEELGKIAAKHGQEVADITLAGLTVGNEDTRRHVDALLASLNDDQENKMAETPNYLKLLGLDENSEPNKKIAKALNAKDEELVKLTAEITDLKAQITESDKLKDDIEDLKKRDRERDIEVILGKATGQGRVAPAEKEKLAELFSDNVQGLRELVATRAAGLFTPKERGHAGGRSSFSLDDPDLASLAKEYKGPDSLDPDSGKLHLAALEVLKARGKANDYSVEDYLTAIDEAEKTLV